MLRSNTLEVGDFGEIVKEYGILYSKEYGFNITQEIEHELWGKMQLEQCYEKVLCLSFD